MQNNNPTLLNRRSWAVAPVSRHRNE